MTDFERNLNKTLGKEGHPKHQVLRKLLYWVCPSAAR